MMELYKKHNINSLNVGCLQIVIQMPLVMALFFALNYTSPGCIKNYRVFLWMVLSKRSVIMIAIEVLVYAVQAYVSMMFLPEEQQKQMRLFMFISPLMILWISFISPSALPLYWAVGGAFLVLQTIIG